MRALYLPELVDKEHFQITGDPLHHLVNVVRVEKGEEVLLLDGSGLSVRTRLESISKKEILLSRLASLRAQRDFVFDLALGVPKRDALELCLKEATEIGMRKVYLVRADFSQLKVPEPDRLQKLLVSALEQSNAYFLPEIIETDWEKLPWTQYSCISLMDSQTEKGAGTRGSRVQGPQLLVIGPEGGFSERELQFVRSLQRTRILKIPTPLMRTPTALAVGAGILLERLMD